jgi:hypothetical protein
MWIAGGCCQLCVLKRYGGHRCENGDSIVYLRIAWITPAELVEDGVNGLVFDDSNQLTKVTYKGSYVSRFEYVSFVAHALRRCM